MYLEIVKVNPKVPVKIKIVPYVSNKSHKDPPEESKYDEEEKGFHNENLIPEWDESEVTDDELQKIWFIYKSENFLLLNFDFRKAKELQDMISYISQQLYKLHKNKPEHVRDGKLIYEPVALAIMSNKGFVTSVKSMKHFFGILKLFPKRSEIYFHVQPFYQSSLTKSSRDNRRNCKIHDASSNISELISDAKVDSDFKDTLDEKMQRRIKEVQDAIEKGSKTDKEVFDLINKLGDTSKVIMHCVGILD